MKFEILLALSLALFFIGLVGIVVKRNLLVILMCMELMLNAVILALGTLGQMKGNFSPSILSFVIYVIAASEIAIAIPIVITLVKMKKTLDVENYNELKG